MFGEKTTEYYAKSGKEIPVWQSPKYKQAKEKAIQIIDSKKYGVAEGDFWILMNVTKTEKMAYTGLIISHNGCLKINDSLPEDQQFRPSCIQVDKNGYKGSLTYTYCCDEQGIYEIGEVSDGNLKNEYPYAMAFKRCFDRVVLKQCKLAYDGVYSDSEADEFKERMDAPADDDDAFRKATREELAQLFALAKQHGITDKDALLQYFRDTCKISVTKTVDLTAADIDKIKRSFA